MKKKLLELSVEEFTRVLLDFEETHHIEVKSADPETGELRKDEIVGTYEQIEDACFSFDSLYEQVKEKLFDYNMDLTELDIYNYLEHQTSYFMKDKVRIVLWEMKCVYDDYCEVVNEEARLEYLEKGWDIPQRTRHNEKLGKDIIFTDYMQMRNKLYPFRESSYFSAIKLLRNKMDGGQTNDLKDVLKTKRVKQVFDGAIEKGWMRPKGKGGYEWIGFGARRGRVQQCVYMCGQIFGYVKGKSGNDGASIPSKALEELFGIDRIYSRLIKCWEAKPQIWRKPIDEMIEKVTASTRK